MKPTLLLLVGSYLAAASASMVISAEQKLDTTVYTTDKCTSIIVAKGAGVEGPMTTHTADCADCDFRINKVPAMDWPKGSTRKLYQYRGSYPATVVSDRGKTWHPDNLEGTPQQIDQWKEMEKTMVTGVIPQVRFFTECRLLSSSFTFSTCTLGNTNDILHEISLSFSKRRNEFVSVD